MGEDEKEPSFQERNRTNSWEQEPCELMIKSSNTMPNKYVNAVKNAALCIRVRRIVAY